MFKVGDKVRCIEIIPGFMDLELDKIYTLDSDADMSAGACYLNIGGFWYGVSRFELVKEENITPLIQTFTDEEIDLEHSRRRAVKRLGYEIKLGKIALEELEKELELLRNQ